MSIYDHMTEFGGKPVVLYESGPELDTVNNNYRIAWTWEDEGAEFDALFAEFLSMVEHTNSIKLKFNMLFADIKPWISLARTDVLRLIFDTCLVRRYGGELLCDSFSTDRVRRILSMALPNYTHNSIHLVTPFDSGGSSAKLRQAFG